MDELKELQETWVRGSRNYFLVYSITDGTTIDRLRDFITLIARENEIEDVSKPICIHTI